MLRSKSRSGAVEFEGKHHSSVFSRTFSAAKFCRGEPLVDREALISVNERRQSSKIVNSSENRTARLSTMQQQVGRLEEELKMTKDQLDAAGEERDRALDELQESKMVANEASKRLNEALSPRKAGQVLAELMTVKELLSNSQKEMVIKDKNIETLKLELEQAKKYEIRLAEKDSSLGRLDEELCNVKASEVHAMVLLSESKKKIEELKAEIENGKASESKMFESIVSQTKELEVTKIELEESKLEIASLGEKMEKSQISSSLSSRELNSEPIDSTKGVIESLSSELKLVKENLARAQESEKAASIKANNLLSEMGILKNELKAAVEGEEKSTKAMEDLALALKEVVAQANKAKEKLGNTEVELEHVKGELEQLKFVMRNNEEKYENLLKEAKKEKELHENTADRLRLEAEESLLAWNGKEMGFVGVIKRAEEERAHAQHDNARLSESLKAAEKMTRTARDENHKLRDILKQALNEANVAKEAASIAKNENSQLKDSIAEKDEALHFLTRENERLRIDEAAAHEKMKELKRLLAAATAELMKTEDKDESGMESGMFMSPESVFEDHKDQETTIKKGFSFDLNEIKLYSKHEDVDYGMEEEEDPVKAEALKGSIFDPTTETPRAEPHTPKPAGHHRRKSSSAMTDETFNSDDFDHLDNSNFEDADGERNSHRRRRSTLLRRFGDIIMRKSFHRREPSINDQEAVPAK